MSIRFVSPHGIPIKGTLEIVYGVCPISNLERNEQGKLEYDYNDEATHFWLDGQETVLRFKDGEDDNPVTRERHPGEEPEVVFVDLDGGEWRESELVPYPPAEQLPNS